MVIKMEQANSGTEQKLENTSAKVSSNGNNVSSSEKRFTDAEVTGKLAEAQRLIHSKEVQPLRDQLKEAQTQNKDLEFRITELTDNENALKMTVAELHTQIEDGLPTEAADAFTQWGKAQTNYASKAAKLERQYGDKDRVYEKQNARILAIEAKELLELHPDSGITAETLIAQGNITDMKAYLFDNAASLSRTNPAQQSNNESNNQTPPQESNPKPTGTQEGAGDVKTKEQILDEMYPTMT